MCATARVQTTGAGQRYEGLPNFHNAASVCPLLAFAAGSGCACRRRDCGGSCRGGGLGAPMAGEDRGESGAVRCTQPPALQRRQRACGVHHARTQHAGNTVATHPHSQFQAPQYHPQMPACLPPPKHTQSAARSHARRHAPEHFVEGGDVGPGAGADDVFVGAAAAERLGGHRPSLGVHAAACTTRSCLLRRSSTQG